MAKVVLARRARQQLLDLNWPLIDAVEDSLGQLEPDSHIGHALRGRLHGLRSLRVGTYRTIYQIAGRPARRPDRPVGPGYLPAVRAQTRPMAERSR